MIPKDCKRLAEVDFPIAEVSRHAAKEKSIRHGHPSTLHLWWARRPLASSRAVLLALLWPDPCDSLCPAAFKMEAQRRLREIPGCNPGTTDGDLRRALLRFIADFANWDNAAQRTYLEVSRALVKAAHAPAGLPAEASAQANGGAYEPPLVVDPFAGGGSIPLEALRVGCEAFASDLNPVACLILKVMLEDIPRHGPELAEELRRVGAEIKSQAEKELADLYPKDPDGATPIAFLWARTVRCESPNCGAEIPLVRSFWLCKKANRRRALRNRVERPKGQPPRVEFEIFEPRAETEVRGPTVTRAKSTCVACGSVLSAERVRVQLTNQRGGADAIFDPQGHRTGGARLLAVVVAGGPGDDSRQYRLATALDYRTVRQASERLERLIGLSSAVSPGPVPCEEIPLTEIRRLSVPLYGAKRWRDLFTARQALALSAVAARLAALPKTAVNEVLALALGRCADYWSSGATWVQSGQFVAHTFTRQALPIVWDFAEAVPWTDSSGNFDGAIDWIARVVEIWPGSRPGQVQLSDAAEPTLPHEVADVWFTDPPYYDAVPYAHLADFFYVWLRRASGSADRPWFAQELSPKKNECVVDRPHRLSKSPKNAAYFESKVARSMGAGREVVREQGIGCVVFAHKTTEGWEALLSGIIGGGWTISASWPVATERATRLNARDTASLATSVHLICRPRPDDAGVGDWAEVLRELPARVGDWMERLQGEGVRGADLVFACIGPALEVFSRHTRVETAEGREVKLDEYLAKVWEVVGRSALAQVLGTAESKARNGAAGAVEEDARLTALFLWTLQATDGEGPHPDPLPEGEWEEETADEEEDEEGASRAKAKGFTLVFDVVRRFAQPLGIELPKWQGRVIETKKGVVRLLPIAERAKQLFGEDGASAVASHLEQAAELGTNPLQGLLFPETEPTPKARIGRGLSRRGTIDVSDENLATAREATTLDRVHAAMLLQASGRTNALRALLKAEKDRGPDFLRLANALSALYPKGSEEKRLLDAMLLAVPR
jgi:adenine-specific DNA methylase